MSLIRCLLIPIFITFILITTETYAKKAAIVIDFDSQEVLFEVNADTKNYPASLTKIMTLYILFDQLEKGQLKNQTKLKVSKIAAARSPSKLYLEDFLGKEVSAFSYPHGKFNSLVREEVMKAGYILGFTSHYDLNYIDQDKLTLNRNEIWNSDNLNSFKKKLDGHWDWLKYRKL